MSASAGSSKSEDDESESESDSEPVTSTLSTSFKHSTHSLIAQAVVDALADLDLLPVDHAGPAPVRALLDPVEKKMVCTCSNCFIVHVLLCNPILVNDAQRRLVMHRDVR